MSQTPSLSHTHTLSIEILTLKVMKNRGSHGQGEGVSGSTVVKDYRDMTEVHNEAMHNTKQNRAVGL